MQNSTFYARAGHEAIKVKDIFSQTFKKHGAGDGAKLFMAGTPLSTPTEAEMLLSWQKPFVYARVFAVGFAFTLLMYILVLMGVSVAVPAFLFLGCFVMPISILMFFWEINIPRNVALYTVLFIFLIGGALSLLFTMLLHNVVGLNATVLAALTEEPGKLFALALFLRKPDKKYILNGMLIGAAVGAGFEAIENAGYAFSADYPTASLLMRGFQSLGGHIMWASLYGGALAMVKGDQPLNTKHFTDVRFLKYFGLSVLLHIFWNSGISILYLPLVGDLWQLLLIAAVLYLQFGMLKKGLAEVVAVANVASGAGTPVYQRPAPAASAPVYQSPAPAASAPVYQSPAPAASAPAYQSPAPHFEKTIAMNFEDKANNRASLICTQGELAGMELPLASARVVLGRDQTRANLILTNPRVSGAHCAVWFENGRVFVSDLGSTNGTFLNGERLIPNKIHELYPASELWLAGYTECYQVKVG
ncbi:MAG TPA: PrsW family glutamic-type intramembrane protease [Clostridia bacterium]|nr:PrsW family glutamic-type intramembrane protease [Clostridia bacterium]